MKNIPITWMDECDSTSRVLKERVKHSAREPMALAAHRQTAGTGRLGRSWQSIPGNLHISISLPAAEIKENLRDILPLAVAVMVGRWTERFALVRPCLKWPNDILVDGRKVAGILCEGTIQGREFLGAVIGIGINLKKAPELSGAGSSVEDGYPAGALADLVGCVILRRESGSDVRGRVVPTDPGNGFPDVANDGNQTGASLGLDRFWVISVF